MDDNTEVKLHFLDYWRVIKLRMGLILLTFFLVMVTAGVYVAFLPREFYSRVSIEIKPDNFKGVDAMNFGGSSRADPQFISTQFNNLRKNTILYPVIEKLDLVTKFSPAGSKMPMSWVARVLDRSMNVQEQRNTSNIEIGVYHTDKQLAADIANTIAIVYRDQRIDEVKSAAEKTLAEMKDELENQRLKVANFFKEASIIRQEEKINDPDPESPNALVTSGNKATMMTEQSATEKRLTVDTLTNQLERIETLKPEELMEALRTLGIEDQTILNTLPRLQETAQDEVKMLNSGLGENHPRLRTVRAQQSQYRKTLSEQLESIRRAQRTKLMIETKNLSTLEAKLATLKDSDISEKDRINRYVDVKSNYLSTKALYNNLQLRYSAEKFNQVLTTIPVMIRERAEPGLSPERPKVITYLALAFIIGLVIGIGLAFFIEYLDTSVKNVEDIERYLSVSVLAVIPKDIAVLIKQKRDSADAEFYRILKANIEFNLTDREANSFTLVSGGPGEGKSTTLSNLAFTFAKGGSRTLVVDADLRRPSQQKFFDDDNSVGLADLLQGKVSIESIIKKTKQENLFFMPSGKIPQDDVGILNSPQMKDLIRTLKKQYDIVFFDSPPILGVSDASMLASEVDNTIMVVQYRRFPRGMLQRVKQAVHHVGGNLVGVVLNNMDTKQDDSYSYYSNYNEYYGSAKKERIGDSKKVPALKSDDGDY